MRCYLGGGVSKSLGIPAAGNRAVSDSNHGRVTNYPPLDISWSYPFSPSNAAIIPLNRPQLIRIPCLLTIHDHLTISFYRSRDPGFEEAAGLERSSLSLVRTTEELLEGKR
jgi:hypothetical protein